MKTRQLRACFSAISILSTSITLGLPSVTLAQVIGDEARLGIPVPLNSTVPLKPSSEEFEEFLHRTTRELVGCTADGASFTLVGRGGLPDDPTGVLPARSFWQDLREPEDAAAVNGARTFEINLVTPEEPQKLREAQGWLSNRNGDVTLVTSAVKAQSPLQQLHCQDLQAREDEAG